MQFTLATAAILTTLITGTVADQFAPYCDAAPCAWQWNQTARVNTCSCNNAAAPNAPLMAAVYSGPNYGGAAYKLFAPVGQCNTLPAGVNNGVQSMQINTAVTPACWIYTNANCAGSQYAVVDKNNVAQMQGIYSNAVQSIICDKPAS